MKSTAGYKAYCKSAYKSIKHSTYFEVYDELFGKYRGKEITFVEIGILGGGSLFMWREFFGPKARIIGVDLNPNAIKWKDHGFEIHIGSQSDEAFWKQFKEQVGPVDLVLDDGGHTYEQQIITTEMLLDNINDGGLLVVEDTHTSYMGNFGPKKYSFIEYAKNMIDSLNQRFGEPHENPQEKRVWGIHLYESIIAFSVNRLASDLDSTPTDNGGIDDGASDYRNPANPLAKVDAFDEPTKLSTVARITKNKEINNSSR